MQRITIRGNGRAENAAARLGKWSFVHVYSAHPPGDLVDYRLFNFVRYLHDLTHLWLWSRMASVSRAFLRVQLAEPPERHPGEVKNRSESAATEDKTWRPNLAHQRFSIFASDSKRKCSERTY